jgi:hypothetical protein
MVRKHDFTWRLCVDYRNLNMLTIKSKFPLPVIDELLDELTRSSWFSKLDLRAGYYHIRLSLGEEYKTAFHTHSGHYQFNVMAFGQTGAPGTFQAVMNETLAPVLRKCALVFFDDILICNRSYEDHLKHLEQVLQLLQQHKWRVKDSKCQFAQRTVSYLGYVIGESGVSNDPKKIIDVQKWLIPLNVKELRGFLGLSGYYRKFVRSYGVISQPLTNLLCKNVPFVWTAEAQVALILSKGPSPLLPCWHCQISLSASILRQTPQTLVLVLYFFSGGILLHSSVEGLDRVLVGSPHTKKNIWQSFSPWINGAHICNMLNL